MMEFIGKLLVVVIAIIFCTLLSIAYLLLALRDSIEENRRDRARERREKQKVYDAVKRIARSCEQIADILATTEILSTVEITEERTIHYD